MYKNAVCELPFGYSLHGLRPFQLSTVQPITPGFCLWSHMAAVIMICIKCLLGMAGGMSQTIADTVDSMRGQEL